MRAFKDQIKANTGPFDLPKVIKTITKNVEVGVGGNSELDGKTVLEYALFAYSLPPGHFFQSKLEGIEESPGFDLTRAPRRTSRRRCRSSRIRTSSHRRRRRRWR